MPLVFVSLSSSYSFLSSRLSMLSLLDPRLARLLLAVVVGATLGVGTAFTVNCTLIEISINAFFAFVRMTNRGRAALHVGRRAG